MQATSFMLPFLIFTFSLQLIPSSAQICYPGDQRTLEEVKAYFGPHDSAFSTWNSSTYCCTWRGIGCNDDGRVLSLSLQLKPTNNVQFQIPSIIINLTKLTYLRITVSSNGELTGPIPVALSYLSSLIHLDLKGNSLNGTIPEFLALNKNLHFIDLSNNQLSGSVPPVLGELSHLMTLRLKNNQLNGTIPEELGQIRGLAKLDMSSNQLEGPIPASFNHLYNLNVFNVSNNQLCGSIPEELSRFKAESFADNKCLCGAPLSPCKSRGGNQIIKEMLSLVE